MKYLFLFLCIAFTTLHGNGQADQLQSKDEQTLISINRHFIQDFLNNDTVEHSKIIHPDFLSIGPDGRISNRQDYMKAWMKGYDKKVMPEFILEEVRIRIFGDMALVDGKTSDKTLKDGQWVRGETRYTDTYVKEKGEWKCVQVQLTRMSSPQ